MSMTQEYKDALMDMGFMDDEGFESIGDAMEYLHRNIWPRIDREKATIYQDVGLTPEDLEALYPLEKGQYIFIWRREEETLLNPTNWTVDMMEQLDDRLTASEEEEIHELAIDLETYSDIDIGTCGVYKYVESDNFEILLFAYAVNGGMVKIVDLASGEKLPEKIMKALTDPEVLKTAYNAAFERICLSKYIKQTSGDAEGTVARTAATSGDAEGTVAEVWNEEGFLNVKQWDCTMVRAARLGLPLSLDECGRVLGIERQKMKEGKALIRYFSVPCKPSKANGGRTRNLPEHAPDKWRTFKTYCKRDVDAEQQIRQRVIKKPVTEKERWMWEIDQNINDRGVLVDTVLAERAMKMDAEAKDILYKRAQELTGLANPNSMVQIKDWIRKKEGFKVDSLNKAEVPGIIQKCKTTDVKEFLKIRQLLGKTSNNKYEAMLRCACKDGRIRGLFQFYGANRTGRWAGRLVQLQNLPQNHIPDLDVARRVARGGDYDEMEMNYGNVTQALSELIRTAFLAKDGMTFHVCDFSAIECRVLAWMAGEGWVLDVFRKGGDIYCATASNMFGVPVEKHGQNAELRQKGKIATLALGYGGGWSALEAMGGSRMGLTQEEEEEIVTKWRSANPHIIRFWQTVEKAAKYCVMNETSCEIQLSGRSALGFAYRWGGLAVTLPSGRNIYYPRMHIGERPSEKRREPEQCLIYEGTNQVTKKWGDIPTYGGKMTENIIQATARDCLAEVMMALERLRFRMVFHVHDEVICECPPEQTLLMIEEVFGKEIPWAKGLPLKGAGYTTPYYKKD